MKINDMHQTCSECGGPAFTDLLLAEKKDACYYKVKASAKVWPSAYASGRLVQCRKKGAKNYGNKSESADQLAEKCWDTHRQAGMKNKGGRQVPNCVPKEGVAEGHSDQQRRIVKKAGKPVGEIGIDRESSPGVGQWYMKHYASGKDLSGYDSMAEALEELKHLVNQVKEAGSPAQQAAIAIAMKKAGKKPKTMNEYNAEYDDEAGMADNNLETLRRAVDGLDDLISAGDNLPEWCQEKIAVAKSMLVNVWDYMVSEEQRGEDPEVEEMYEAMEQLVAEMARKHGTNPDLVWEQFEALPDQLLYETAAWRRKEGKSKTGGLNKKGVASYRREHPGSKLQTAVTTKPSKLKKGSKAAKRRKSFCARMSGVKGPMKKPNGKPTRKALALRKWNC